MPAVFYIKSGDLLPILQAILKDAKGQAVDLSTASTVTFRMRPKGGTTATVSGNANILTPEDGLVAYIWNTGDTDTPGEYEAEFEVFFSGKPETFPNHENMKVMIQGAVG